MSKKNESLNTRLTRMQESRLDRERRMRRFIILGSILVGVVTVVLVAAALLQMFVLEPQRAVASVGGQAISLQQLQKRMRYEQSQVVNQYNRLSQNIAQLQTSTDPSNQFLLQLAQQQLQSIGQQGSAEAVAQTSLSNMIDEGLIKREANNRGIVITPEEVTAELERNFGLYRQTLTPFPTDTPAPPATATAIPVAAVTGTVTTTVASTVTVTPPPTATPRLQPTSIADADFQLLYNRTLESYQGIGFTDADLRGLVESSLYQQRLQQVFADGVAKDAPHFKFDYVRFNNEADAASALAELTSNQITFPALITRTNEITQPQPVGSGGSLDWTPASVIEQQFGPEIASQLAVKATGTPAGVFTSTLGGAYVLLPLGRETRPLSESDLQQQQQQAFTEWLNQARNDASLVTRPATLNDVIPSDVRNAARNFLANFGQ